MSSVDGQDVSPTRWSRDAALRAVSFNAIMGSVGAPLVIAAMLHVNDVEPATYVVYAVVLSVVTMAMGVAARRATRSPDDDVTAGRVRLVYLLMFATGLWTGLAALIPVESVASDDPAYPYLLATIVSIIPANIAAGYSRISMYWAIAAPMVVPVLVGGARWGGPVGFVVVFGATVIVTLTAMNARQAGLAFRTATELMKRNGRLVAELERSVAELDRQAHLDPLTGLANRAGLARRLCETRSRPGPQVVLYIDLDEFKFVNDSHGHGVGDTVLMTAAQRIVEIVGDAGFIARLGGDEFVVIADADADDGAALTRSLHEALCQPVHVGEIAVPVAASVGCTTSKSGDDLEQAIVAADGKMYQCKTHPKPVADRASALLP